MEVETHIQLQFQSVQVFPVSLAFSCFPPNFRVTEAWVCEIVSQHHDQVRGQPPINPEGRREEEGEARRRPEARGGDGDAPELDPHVCETSSNSSSVTKNLKGTGNELFLCLTRLIMLQFCFWIPIVRIFGLFDGFEAVLSSFWGYLRQFLMQKSPSS